MMLLWKYRHWRWHQQGQVVGKPEEWWKGQKRGCFCFLTQIVGFILIFTEQKRPASSQYSPLISWITSSSPHHVLIPYLSNLFNLHSWSLFSHVFSAFLPLVPPELNQQTQVLSILKNVSSHTVGYLFSCSHRHHHALKASHFSKWATSLMTATRINVLTLMSHEKWVMVGLPGCYPGMWFIPVLNTAWDHAAAAFLGPFVGRDLPKGKSCLIESYWEPNACCLEVAFSGIS